MALVAVIDLRVEAEMAQGPDAAESEEKLLFEPVLPVSAIELVCDLTVFRSVCLVVSVEQIEVGTAHSDLPDARGDSPSRECDACGDPVAVSVENRRNRDAEEVLGIISCHLVALCGEDLSEISVTVEEADCDEVDIHVAGFLEVVAGKDAETAGIDFQGSVESVLHAEIGDLRVGPLLLESHIGVELIHDCFILCEESRVACEFPEPLEAHGVKQCHRVVARCRPHFRINCLEKGFCTVVPAPPEVL